MGDFVRRLPDSDMQTARRKLWQVIHIDPLFLICILSLVGVGLVVLYSGGNDQIALVKKQAIFASAGMVVMLGVAQLPVPMIRRWVTLGYLVGLLALIAVMFVGLEINGAKRWVDLGVINFQPSEAMKLMLPMSVAAYLSQHDLPPTFFRVAVSLAMIGLPIGLIIIQPDLGTSLLIAASGLIVLFMAGLRWRYIGSALLIVLISAPLMWNFGMHDYQRSRVLTMFNPEQDKLGAGWNTIQATTAIGSGGLEGKGWLKGTQSHLNFLPESHTDFIVAVLAEEFGFQGVCGLLLLYLLLMLRGLWISYRAQSNFGRLVAGAFTFVMFVYVFVNMGMVSGILPIVGVPLPLISYGGTALLTMFAMFGVMMAISTETKKMNL